MKIVLLDKETLGEVKLDSLEKLGKLKTYSTTSKDQVSERIKNADIIITNKVILNEEVLKNAKSLKLICIAATGINNVDMKYCVKQKIEVKNVVGYSTDSVVQLTFNYIFYFLQNLKFYDDFTSSGKWAEQKIFTYFTEFRELSSLHIGIIGLGEIGLKTASVARAFGAKVSYYSTSGKNSNSLYDRLELEELLQNCDIISIHAPLNSATQNLINYDRLNLLKKDSLLLNLGRGGIINEDDLYLFIKENPRKINVALDVLEEEPMEKKHKLLELIPSENILITPHIGWASKEARDRLIQGINGNIVKFIQAN